MKADLFVSKLKSIANSYNTLYVLGSIGSPLDAVNKKRYTEVHCAEYNGKADRKEKILASSPDTFGFDCVCLIKSVLWGWTGNENHTYGGAKYESYGIPDVGANEILKFCEDVSSDFSKIQKGELLWREGHVGVYIGDGLAVECSPIWKDGVQVTAVNKPNGVYNVRIWHKHGKLIWVDYDERSDIEFVQNKCGLEDKTIDYLCDYKYSVDLFAKIRKAIEG